MQKQAPLLTTDELSANLTLTDPRYIHRDPSLRYAMPNRSS
jgi:hypothetical protein